MRKAFGSAAPGVRQEIKRAVTVVNRRGLHARAAARFVKLAAQYRADITVERNGTEVSGISIMGLMMLAAGPGSEIVIRARGIQAEEAVDALERLIQGKFDEE
ncbi:MAG: HPr family phosphocarrier protein [Alphaproteobacteria bacterium]